MTVIESIGRVVPSVVTTPPFLPAGLVRILSLLMRFLLMKFPTALLSMRTSSSWSLTRLLKMSIKLAQFSAMLAT